MTSFNNHVGIHLSATKLQIVEVIYKDCNHSNVQVVDKVTITTDSQGKIYLHTSVASLKL